MRLIDADDIREWVMSRKRLSKVLTIMAIDETPTISPDSLRPKGRWTYGSVEPGWFTPGGNRPWICSECGHLESWMIDRPKVNFCPFCGADMREEAE